MGKCVPSGGLNPPIVGRNLPRTGPENSMSRLFNALGTLIQERWYGSDGHAIWDRDHTDHGNPRRHPQVPHDHAWPGGVRDENWRMPSGSC